MPAIHQLVAGFAENDAISNETCVLRSIFRSWGYESDILSERKYTVQREGATEVKDVDMNKLRDLGDELKNKIGSGVVALFSEADGKVNMIAMATDGAVKAGAHAGNLIKGIAALVGGGGGGRPNMAQAGGKNPAGIPAAIAEASKVLEGQL